MKYERLLSISLKHSYYKDGVCPDITVSPQKYSPLMLKKDLEDRHSNKNTEKWLTEKDTDTLLRNHRCLLKPKINGIDIYVPVNDNKTPLIEFAQNTKLSFDLRLKNSEFPLFTDLTNIPDNGSFEILDTEQAPDRQFGDKVFATINIQRDFNKIDESAANIDFEFSAKSVRWVYWLVTNQGSKESDFSIAINPADTSGFTWQQKLIDESDQISSVLAREYPKMRRLCFVSEQNIPCQESAIKNIQLLLGQNKVFENLPAPPIRNHYRTSIDNTPKQADAIYTIVKSITNTTLTKV